MKISQKLILFSFITTASIAFAELSNQAVSDCYERQIEGQWKYIEFEFFFKPARRLERVTKNVQAGALSLASLLFLTTNIFKSKKTQLVPDSIAFVPKEINFNTNDLSSVTIPLEQKKYKKEELSFNVPSAIATSALCVTSYYMFSYLLSNQIKRETLINFLQNWNFHKKYVPTELISAFDQLAADFKTASTLGATFNQEQIDEIFDIMQHLLEHVFEKRYGSNKQAFDTLGVFKTITEIGKNLKP